MSRVILPFHPLAPESLTENQLESIQKSLAQKKEQADHEVKKAAGLFEKITNFYHTFTKVKTAVVVLFSIYHFFGGSGESNLLPIMLSLAMSVILFKKKKASKKAIKAKNHLKVKKIFKRTISLAAVFLVIYLMWSAIVFKSFQNDQKVVKPQLEAVKTSLQQSSEKVTLELPKLAHARIGAPAAKFGNKFERKQFKDVLPKIHEETPKKKLNDLELNFELPSEFPLYFFFGLISLFIGVKFFMYFSHFSNYKNALERQEKIITLINHFQSVNQTQVSKVETQEEIQVVPQPEVKAETLPQDYPTIEEEPVRLASISDYSSESNRIIEVGDNHPDSQ